MVLDKIQKGIEERMSKGGINFGSILKVYLQVEMQELHLENLQVVVQYNKDNQL